MSLADDYSDQFRWRDWSTALNALPPLAGQTVIDLGCAVGDLAAEFVKRGAHVVGLDLNDELLQVARSRGLANADFRLGDLRSLPQLEMAADGLWCSFAAAYFPRLSETLPTWLANVKPGGWVALTEIDDMFAHEPLSARTKTLLDEFVNEALDAERYDFRMGRKLGDCLERAGLTVTETLWLADQELAFDGPASAGVSDAWRSRFERMQLLRQACGTEFDRVRDEFIACLSHSAHRAQARVCCCIATKPAM